MSKRVQLAYGTADIVTAPTWGQMKDLFAARQRALADPEHGLDLQSTAIRVFTVGWHMTDPDGNALAFPDDIDRLYFEDALALNRAIDAMIAETRADPNASPQP